MPKRIHPVDWRTRKTQRSVSAESAQAHDAARAELYRDDDFLREDGERIAAKIRLSALHAAALRVFGRAGR